jgi:hypothetical protein
LRNLLDIIRGSRSNERKQAQRIPQGYRRARNPVSRKVWKMLTLDGHEVLTPWAVKERKHRRAAGKVSKQARKVNRRYRATGGLR